MAERIEDYAMIGDCKTAALVSKQGSIDWLCLPRFDSMACFANLLGTEQNGYWRIAPVGNRHTSRRAYIDGSLVLTTRFESARGVVELTDFMPTGLNSSHVVRMVTGVKGRVKMQSCLNVRFDYGLSAPWITEADNRTMELIAGPDILVLRTDTGSVLEEGRIVSAFEVKAGERVSFVLSHGASHLPPPSTFAPERLLQQTKAFWKGWSGRCEDAGRWTDIVRRSLITLKGLTYEPTGGIVAAATTSLPERIGGDRNWDYRFCWLRDASVTLLALLTAGYDEEADAWRNWLLRAAAGDPEQIQIMYGVAGEKRLEEWTLPWLPGYEGSAPVRVGNEAAKQLQLDIYGELFNTMSIAADGRLLPLARGLEFGAALLAHLEKRWSEPDAGIWEMRGDLQHFTHSKVMAWVAFDRAANNPNYPVDRATRRKFRRIADAIHRSVSENAVDPERNCFTQAYGNRHLDAGLLLMPLVGFLPPDDPRMLNTVAEIERRLMTDGLVLRYETGTGVDGLSDGEGAFLACSFWLVDNYVLQGRHDEAEALFDRLASLANDVGLFAEEYDPHAARQLGNFPQAFTHVALVNSAFLLAKVRRA
jgi:GH15 family glucan-1,4-alpha-glucosidase